MIGREFVERAWGDVAKMEGGRVRAGWRKCERVQEDAETR